MGRVVFLLPGEIHPRTWLVGFDVSYEVFDCLLELVYSRWFHSILTSLIQRHADSPFSAEKIKRFNRSPHEARVLSCLRGLRQGTNLLQKFHHRHLDPVLAYLPILHPVNMNLGPVDSFVGWFLSHQRSA